MLIPSDRLWDDFNVGSRLRNSIDEDERLTAILRSCGITRNATPTELLLAKILQTLETIKHG